MSFSALDAFAFSSSRVSSTEFREWNSFLGAQAGINAILEILTHPLRKRLEYKKELAIHLMELGLSEKKVFSVLRFIEYLMWLPKDMVIEYRNATQEYREKKKMPFITPSEEIAKEEGIQIGEYRGSVKATQEILSEMLIDRFGKIPASLKKTIQSIEDTARLKTLCKNVIRVDSL